MLITLKVDERYCINTFFKNSLPSECSNVSNVVIFIGVQQPMLFQTDQLIIDQFIKKMSNAWF